MYGAEMCHYWAEIESQQKMIAEEPIVPDQHVGDIFIVEPRKLSWGEWVLRMIVGKKERANFEKMDAFELAVQEEMVGMTTTDAETVAEVEKELHECPTGRRVALPKLVAYAACAIRAKFGESIKDKSIPGNVELVRSRIAVLMKDLNVRHCDRDAHALLIESCVFEEDVFSRIPQTRQRMAARSWVYRWLLKGREQPKARLF